MTDSVLHPGLVLMVGALALPWLRGTLRNAAVVVLPLLVLALVWRVPDGAVWQVQFLDHTLTPLRGDKLSRLLPQRFAKLLPHLKSSDFDYIIFDMPPVSQISITPRLAGFMDMVLLVVESEKNSREGVQRASALLAESNAHVGAVMNKTKNYVPNWVHEELPV